MFIAFAQQQDIEGWMDLLYLVKDNFPGLDMDEYRSALTECILNEQALIAKSEDTVVGALTFSRSTGELNFLAVHPHIVKKVLPRPLYQN